MSKSKGVHAKHRSGSNHNTVRNRARLCNRILDADQIREQLTPEKLKQYENRSADPFLPGEGKYYCLICDKYFINQQAFSRHEKGGQHRIRLREVKQGGFTVKQAEQAAGKGVDNGIRKEKGRTVVLDK